MKSVDFMSQDKLGTYAKLVPCSKTTRRIHAIANKINVENLISRRAMHTTVIYSRVKCKPSIPHDVVELPIVANGSHFDLFDNPDRTKSLVLVLESKDIHSLHKKLIKEHNATHDYPSFQPHITLSYDFTQNKVPNKSIIEYFQELTFNRFIVEPLILGWHPNTNE